MSSSSRKPRRRPTADEHDEEPPRRRRHIQATGQRRAAADEDSDEEAESSRTQQSRRHRRAEEEDEDMDDTANVAEEDEDEDGSMPQTQLDRQQMYTNMLAKKLVRYALACEPRRVPLRRQAMKEQALDNQGKNFKKVFPVAQDQLQAIFGMKMVEWPSRDETTMSVRERRKALKAQKQTTSAAATARSDRFVLVSALPASYRACVFAHIPAEKGDAPGIAPIPPAPDAAYMGLATLVVALITLGGGVLSNADLEKYLTMLYGAHQLPIRSDAELLPVSSAIGEQIDDGDGAAATSHGADDSEGATQGGTLQYLVRHGYLVRVVETPSIAEGRASTNSRPAGSDSSKVAWHVGPRGRLEIGPSEVAAVVRHIYGPAAGADLEQRLQSSLRAAGKERAEPRSAAHRGEREGEPVEG